MIVARCAQGAAAFTGLLVQRSASGEPGRPNLDSYRAVQPHLVSEIDDPHPAATDFPLQRVATRERGLEGQEEVSRHTSNLMFQSSVVYL